MSKTDGPNPGDSKKRPGRETAYTNAKAVEILDRIAEGESVSAICKDDHLPPSSTVFGWVKDDRHGFADRYARAREIQCDVMFDKLAELSRRALGVATGAPGTGEAGARVQAIRLEIDVIKWTLAKRFPSRWADRMKNEVTGPNGGPVQSENLLRVTSADEDMIVKIREKREALSSDD